VVIGREAETGRLRSAFAAAAAAADATGHARRIGLTVNRVNRGLLGYAEAILVGRAGDPHWATKLAAAADADLRHYPVWADLVLRLVAEGSSNKQIAARLHLSPRTVEARGEPAPQDRHPGPGLSWWRPPGRKRTREARRRADG
jgi:hypothetical protein